MNKRASGNSFKFKTELYLSLILSIFLTFLTPARASSSLTCDSLFTQIQPPSAKLKVLSLPAWQRVSHQNWERTFSEVKTFSQFENLLHKITNSYPHLTDGDIYALQNINLILIAKRMSSKDQIKLRKLVDLYVHKISQTKNSQPVGHWFAALEYFFYPGRLYDFIQKIEPMSAANIRFQQAFSGELGLWSLNTTFISAIEQLPVSLKQELIAELHKKFLSIPLESEILSMKDGKLQAPTIRSFRRNLEVISFLILKTDIETLKSELAKSEDQKSIINAINKYYKKEEQIFAPLRGGYSFKRVLDTAEIIQKHFSVFFKSNSDYIDLYGSFPNGKANFKTSDIDIKFSDNLLIEQTGREKTQMQEEPFSLFFADMVERNKNQLPNTFPAFWMSYRNAETEISKSIFGGKTTKPSELLTALYPPQNYSNDTRDFRWYNPLVIRIHKNEIHIQILDLMGSKPQVLNITIPSY